MSIKVTLSMLLALVAACAALYPQPSKGGSAPAAYGPRPYNFKYDIKDPKGNEQGRSEEGDGSGTVTGTYSYRLANGIFRRVRYVADKIRGFRAFIESNEPGVGDKSPADVKLTSHPAPYGVDQREPLLTSYNRRQPVQTKQKRY